MPGTLFQGQLVAMAGSQAARAFGNSAMVVFDSAGHLRSAELCAKQVRAKQVRAKQVRAKQVRATQVRATQVRATQVTARTFLRPLQLGDILSACIGLTPRHRRRSRQGEGKRHKSGDYDANGFLLSERVHTTAPP